MELHVPAGAATIELRYAVTAVDWAARAASLAGVVVLLIAILFGKRLERRFAGAMADDERMVPVQQD
jgi:hypothetical protein